MDDTNDVHAAARPKRVPVTFRLRSDLVRLVESIAAKRGEDRNAVLERWTEARLEGEYPGCTDRAA